MLKPGSSPVDWCESNYIYSPFIAEYANTVSNIIFFALPPVLIWLFQPYANHCNRGIYVVWGMLIVVGACSMYFHATLSLLGQLLDELAILWVFSAAFAIWFPSRYLPLYFRRKRSSFSFLVLAVAVISSLLALIQPAFNAFALMTLGVPTLVLLVSELSRCDNSRVLRLGARCGAVWILAVACWVNDRMFCETWSNLNFPYLHAFWHVLIFIASYTACVLFAYFDAKHQVPEQDPVLKYWPNDRYEFLSVPYIGLSGGSLTAEVDTFVRKQHLI
ncbi:Alkaline ceramidase 2 [Orchesella cincta]|uniref:Alkaline ceramidase n=1 Tax=Orchesella cincta TaxID=48709 RepID=A0A1D2N317_ORCCI|nr:Alkaline ceramidase 2 [Orchesella cincta]